MFNRARQRRRYHFRVYLGRTLLVGISIAALAGFWWWLAQLGPRSVQPTGAAPLTRAVQAEAKWEELRTAVAQKLEGIPDDRAPGAQAALEEVIALQKQVVAQGGGAGQAEARRLSELEQRLAELVAATTNRRIEALDAAAEAARAAGETATATAAWSEALALQRDVNRSAATAVAKNFVREARIDQARQELTAAPLAEEVSEALRAARAAVQAQDWAGALAAYGTARDRQVRINGEFARTKYADLVLLGNIEREIQSLDATGPAGEVDEREAAGDRALAADDFRGAALAFEEARQLQMRVNREFARSRFQSAARVEQLEVKRQTADSVPLIEALRAEDRAIAFLLRRRETENANQRIAAAETSVRALFNQLPKSTRLDAALQLKITYLASQRERLGEIQDAVLARLRPLPGAAELRLFTTEFPQVLYLQVMKSNPSRHAGRAFPVDSVSWEDATMCCQRLGWLLGRTVRLPTADEFRVALGPVGPAGAGGDGGGTKNEAAGQNQSREMALLPANEAGFYDLVGNLAEWLQDAVAGTAGDRGLVAGGSYLDRAETTDRNLTQVMARTDRARHVGFRVVVEWAAE